MPFTQHLYVENMQLLLWGKSKIQMYPTFPFPFSVQLGPNVSIGTGVTIGAGVRVRESIILHGATLQVSPCETASYH